jgi:energy coupling factor transporter S component ThiW
MKCVEMSAINIKKVSLATMLIALGVVLAPYLWFPILDTKAYPGQHLVNAIGGVLLGPFWAAFIALCIGIVRMSIGWGTIFSIPGGMPGGFVVGCFCWLLRKYAGRYAELAAFTEPIGTIFIGGTLAVYLFAPLVGREMVLIPIWVGWAFSCIPGATFGFITLIALRLAGIRRELFSK